MTAIIAPAASTPIGMARRGFLISWPTKEVTSRPENAKHMADHSASVSMPVVVRGTSAAPVNDVADPNFASATAPAPISMPAGTHTPIVPQFWIHFPVRRPTMLMMTVSQMPRRTKRMAYDALSLSASYRAPPMASAFEAANSSSDG